VLHGGPGGGLHRKQLRHFDLTKWQVVLFDQRGCGRSQPLYSIHKNTTWDLVADIEKLREAVGVDRWTVFGGSWGSTLALAYAAKHLKHVDALVVRGIYLGEPRENDWLYKEGGASSLYPEEWTKFASVATGAGKSRKNLTATYRRLLQSKDRKTRRRAAAAWWGWESAISLLVPKPDDSKASEVESLAILENHYFSHTCWLKPGQLLAAARRIPASIPVHIVQGRYDLVCPPASAFALAQAVPHAHLTFTLAGHAGSEKPTAAALRAATDSLLR
jgi:proline iminopeptidase